MSTEVTVGIDIGTTSVKAVAADADGQVVARAKIATPLHTGDAGELAHDAKASWHDGVRSALAALLEPSARTADGSTGSDGMDLLAVNVSAMVPSLCAVDGDGVPVSDGLLYGDQRGAGGDPTKNPSESGELVRFLAWLAGERPDAAGYWPAQAVANRALGGPGTIDTVVAMTTLPLFDFTGWDTTVAADAGVTDTAKLPGLQPGQAAIGEVDPSLVGSAGVLLGPGTIDAYGEQLVSGAEHEGDVLVIMGGTLIVWAVVPDWVEVPGLWTVPHTVPGKVLIGGPSNAGGLFVNWVDALLGEGPVADGRSGPVPVWQPYLRGERVPIHDADRRASLSDLHVGMDTAAVRRAAYEASGFAIRHMLDMAGVDARRIVATGGGVHRPEWVGAVADAAALPVDVVAVPEGAALGAAYLGRITAGREADASGSGRWARTSHRVDPSPEGVDAAAPRYRRYRHLAGC